VVTKARILRMGFLALLFCLGFPRVGSCQGTDDTLTAEGRALLKGFHMTPVTVPLIEQRADNGDGKSQFLMGWIYFIGDLVPKDDGKAIQWMTKAANQNVPFARTQLGLMYLSATDVPGNYGFARELLLKGAAENETDALNGLGVIYSKGLGVPVNADEAIKYFRQAADAGFADAQYNLGYQYETGKLVPQDSEAAVKWLRLASDQDDPRAAYLLGVMFRDGHGVPQDYSEAFRLFQKGAEQYRFAGSQQNLGAMYYLGKGAPENLVLAYMWISLAAGEGLELSKKTLPAVAEKMTPQQIAEAKQKAEDWTKAHQN
jgi:uncharacterized protein